MLEIQADVIDSYQNGYRKLMMVTAGGTFNSNTKEGPVLVPYRAGDMLLADAFGNVIVGPVGMAGAIDLADRVLDGDSRALTHPLTILALAVALAAFRVDVEPELDRPEPLEMAVHA